ncbi:hypothetical protein [Nannocystis pusilla]|uniref:Uncharacterized protein n=1 Tax=Nannocystis pusilla TaxID=889268 RepID=A0ABS7TP30_9BACT|nr:hypothetical protein [Nannocystis pusilla]MBZ5709945.1 hypothetical protein [Nannocystis pusilla]
MRNALNILAGIALLVGAVAPAVHAGSTNDPWPSDPKDPESYPSDPKDSWPSDPKDPESWPEDPKEEPKEDPKEDPKHPDPWPEDPKHPWPPKDKCEPSKAEGGCPTFWELKDVTEATESFDKNDDGCVCVKIIPGQGKGNTGAGKNVKDNNNPKH